MKRKDFWRQRPLLTLPQFIIMLAIIIAIYVALDLNRRARAGQLVGIGEEALQQELMLETTRQVELQATLDYVQSDDYVAAYARDEGGQLQPGEVRVVPLPIEATPPPPAAPAVTPAPALDARPWQAWWRLLTDAPHPSP
jgi:cell division protein FtsB